MIQKKKKGLHKRNPHNQRYNFPELISTTPLLKQFTAENKHGDISIDFADPAAVKMLNKALLHHFYKIILMEVPPPASQQLLQHEAWARGWLGVARLSGLRGARPVERTCTQSCFRFPNQHRWVTFYC